jgi:hypothetical protein
MLIFFNIARNTFRECFRTNVFFVLLTSCLLFIGLLPQLSLFVFNEKNKMIIDSSMAITLFFAMLIAVLLASHTFYREATNGTLLLLLSKPVPRYIFVSAKVFGVLLTLTFFLVTCGIACINSLTISISQFQTNYYNMIIFYAAIILAAIWGAYRDYFKGYIFTESASLATLFFLILQFIQNFVLPIGDTSKKIIELQLHMLPALLLILFSVWILGSITIVFSTRFNVVINLMLSFPVYILGLMSHYLIGKHIASSFLCKILYTIIPNWQYFWMADAVSSGVKIPFEYILWAFIYTILYITTCIIVATIAFKSKELGSNKV